jgi:hypothetical protein
MRCCKIITWILILSIINFALGAPAAIRERLDMSVDVDVAEGGTATWQKRYDPLDDWSTTTTPSSLSPSDLDRFWEELGEEQNGWYIPPLTPESPASTESVDSSPGSPTGSHPGPTDGYPLHPLPHPGPSESRFPSPPGWSVNTDALLSTGHQPTPPQSPTGSSPLPPLPHPGPSEDRFPSTLGLLENLGTLSSTGYQPTPLQAGSSPLSHPGSSEDHCPSPHCWLATSDTLSSTGSQPTPPQSPALDPVTPPPPSPEPPPDEFLDRLLKGKIKRRISGSGTVDSALTDF